MNSDSQTPLLPSTPPKRKVALVQEPAPLSPWEAARVAAEIRQRMKRAKHAAVMRAEKRDCQRKITINSYTKPTPFGNVGGKPPLPATANAVLLYNVNKRFWTNLEKCGWECNPEKKQEWCFAGPRAQDKEYSFVSSLRALEWPFVLNLHYAGDYTNDYISSPDITTLQENPNTVRKIRNTGMGICDVKVEPGVSAPAPRAFVDLSAFDDFSEFNSTDYPAVFCEMDKYSAKTATQTATDIPPAPPSTTLAPAAVFSPDSDDDTDAEGAAAPARARARARAPAPIVYHATNCEAVSKFFKCKADSSEAEADTADDANTSAEPLMTQI